MELKYKRALIKLSGEALAGNGKSGFDDEIVESICKSLKECSDMGLELAVVVGGGNFWRGRASGEMDRTHADQMGMLATVMNSIYISDTLNRMGCKSKVQTSINMAPIAEMFNKDKAVEELQNGTSLIFGGGTGNPYFSTDTASALRGIEIGADVILKATMVDGVYDCDPHKFSNAVKYDTLSYKEILEKELCVMDMAAAALCSDNNMSLIVFNLEDSNNIVKAVCGDNIGTVIHK